MDSAALLRETIVKNIKTGSWRAGHRIPTERALCEQFGIGRAAVRRVLGQLKEAQLITQTVGSGTYVAEGVDGALARMSAAGAARASSPAELMEARLTLEPSIVEMVIRNATPADFARMQECCDRAEAAGTLDEFEHWDGLLHEVIAEAAHNGFISNVFRLLNEAREQGEWGMLKRKSVTPARRAEYQQEHRQLVAALMDRDLASATERTRGHLLHVRRNLLGL